MTDEELIARLREPMNVTLREGAPELDDYDAEREMAANHIAALIDERDAARAQISKGHDDEVRRKVLEYALDALAALRKRVEDHRRNATDRFAIVLSNHTISSMELSEECVRDLINKDIPL